jgi:FtsP/CotA-like multicopper oxidase with cupredoxin domain
MGVTRVSATEGSSNCRPQANQNRGSIIACENDTPFRHTTPTNVSNPAAGEESRPAMLESGNIRRVFFFVGCRLRKATVVMVAALSVFLVFADAQTPAPDLCPRPAPGSIVASPPELSSHKGVLAVSLHLRGSTTASGEHRYCYVDEIGNQSPTLRLKPGDLLIVKLKNELGGEPSSTVGHSRRPDRSPCLAWDMHPASTNLHFHGLSIPPACHEDDVLNTTISPQSGEYEYRVRIPANQPPGLYWYHPHPHGHSEEQVLGGASGAIIVEGIERFEKAVAGLPERLLVIRDQPLPASPPLTLEKPPSKNLSVNFVPVPYPDYPPALIKTKPSERELWRVLNASADTFVDLHLLCNGHWQTLGLIALDGVPVNYEPPAGKDQKDDPVKWVLNIAVPPGGRAEFLFDTPPEGGWTQLLTAGVDTTPPLDEDDPKFAAQPGLSPAIDDDDYTPPRWLVKVLSASDALEPPTVPSAASPRDTLRVPPLAMVQPVRTRRLYFSEKILDPKNPRTSTVFFLTEEGHAPRAFDPAAGPNITVRLGDVEDWILENRSQEAHTFHMHQSHFVVLARDNSARDENYLRDTVDIPYWDGVSPYPSVRLRMDFRNPAIVGTFPYHCHILQHEDGGMMGTIRVVRARR